MRSGGRIGVLALAFAVLVVGFFVARGAGEEESASTPAATPTTVRETGGEPHANAAPRGEPRPRVERLRLRDGAPAGEVRTLRYDDGDTVRLRFSSDVADEVHVHGVDRYVQVPAGGTASMRFRTPGQGIFEIESHTSGELIARLEVR